MQDGMAQTAIESAQAPTNAQPQAAHGADVAAKIDALERQVAKLKDENGNRRMAADAAAEEAARKDAEAGNYKTQADLLRAQLDELKPKLAMVDEAQEFMTATAREIDALKPTLPTYLQTAIDAAPSLKAKREIVSQYQAAQPQHTRGAPIPVANPASAQPDFAAALGNERLYDEAMRNHKTEFTAYIRGGARQVPQTSYDMRFQPK